MIIKNDNFIIFDNHVFFLLIFLMGAAP